MRTSRTPRHYQPASEPLPIPADPRRPNESVSLPRSPPTHRDSELTTDARSRFIWPVVQRESGRPPPDSGLTDFAGLIHDAQTCGAAGLPAKRCVGHLTRPSLSRSSSAHDPNLDESASAGRGGKFTRDKQARRRAQGRRYLLAACFLFLAARLFSPGFSHACSYAAPRRQLSLHMILKVVPIDARKIQRPLRKALYRWKASSECFS